MKKLLIAIVAMALSGAAMALTLQAAKAQIPGAVANPAKMAEIMKELSEEDQIEFLALVNAAIAEMNASSAEAAAMYLAVNEAALKAHGEGNLRALLATTFATVPPEALTILNEQLAKDLFNRNADPTRPVSDADFAVIAKEAMEAIATRNSDTDEAAVRDTFALLMFLRASEGTPADLRDALLETFGNPEAQQTANTEWIDPALKGDYNPMLGGSDVDLNVPTVQNVQDVASDKDEGGQGEPAQPETVETPLTIASSAEIVPLLGDLGADTTDFIDAAILNMPNLGLPEMSGGQPIGGGGTGVVHPSPINDSPWTQERGADREDDGGYFTPVHPDPYWGQTNG